MTAVDHAELGRTTYEANSKQFDIHPFFARSAKWDELPDETKAHYAMVERTVTAPLLSEIEGLKAADARLHAITKAGDCPKCELTKAQCADSIAEVEVGRRTQAPDSWRPDREAVKAALGCIRPRIVTGWRGEMVMGLGMEGLDQATDRILALTKTSTSSDCEPQQ